MVITDRGIVATSQTLASQAGAQVWRAADRPWTPPSPPTRCWAWWNRRADGIGGDLFAIYWDAKTGKLSAINASGWAPTGLTIDFLKSQGLPEMPQEGIHSVTVPGCVDGWEKLHQRFGKLPWDDLFQPAIYFADHGYPGHRDDRRGLEDGRSQARQRRERASAFSCATGTRRASARCSAIRKWRRR